MRYTIVVSTLLVASVGAIHVDATAEPTYYARDLQTDSYLQIRDVDGFFTTILPRSPGGGSPGGSGGRASPPKPQGQLAQKAEAKGRSGSSVPPSLASGKSSSISPPGSPSKGGSGSRSGASTSKSDPLSKWRATSPENPFAAAASIPIPSGDVKIFPPPSELLRFGGTLVPQPRRRPKMFHGGDTRGGFSRAPFGGRGQVGSGRESRPSGRGRESSTTSEEGLRGTAVQGRAGPQEGRGGRGRPPGLQSGSKGDTGQGPSTGPGSSSSQSEQGPSMEKRSTKDKELHTHFARFLDDRHTHNVYVRSLADTESLWVRDLAENKALLETRASGHSPKSGNGGNGGSAGRGTQRRNSSDTRASPVRTSSPPTESPPPPPRPMRLG